jgi:hypothetical protein
MKMAGRSKGHFLFHTLATPKSNSAGFNRFRIYQQYECPAMRLGARTLSGALLAYYQRAASWVLGIGCSSGVSKPSWTASCLDTSRPIEVSKV